MNIPHGMDGYIQSVVSRFFSCRCVGHDSDGAVIHNEACLLNFRHLALAACREVATTDHAYRTALEAADGLYTLSKGHAHRLQERCGELESTLTKYEDALIAISNILEKTQNK